MSEGAHQPPPAPDRWLVVGLGNPGPRYELTPHNLGFLTVERLAEANGIRVTRPEDHALVGLGRIRDVEAVLARPQAFMNLSGPPVRALMDRYEVGIEGLLVVFDDLGLPWPTLRVRPKGSSGGHKGVDSVIRAIGTNEFPRLRLGIHPGHPISDGADFVLAPFRRAQFEELDRLLDEACRAVESIIAVGVEQSMTKFNRRARGPNEDA